MILLYSDSNQCTIVFVCIYHLAYQVVIVMLLCSELIHLSMLEQAGVELGINQAGTLLAWGYKIQNLLKPSYFDFFRQHIASIYGFFRQSVSFVKKKNQATSKQGMRLNFGMLIALTNIRSTKVLHHASCIMHHRLLLTKVEG